MDKLANLGSSELGARLVDHSSQVHGCEASHVLTGPLQQLWLSEEGLPQWLCISLSAQAGRRSDGAEESDLCVRTVGWHCWHPYSSNPKEVTLHVSADGSKFKVWDTFSCAEPAAGRHLFCCVPINVSIYSFIAIEVTQAFGGTQTYMNRVYLYSEEVPSAQQSSGQRTHAPEQPVTAPEQRRALPLAPHPSDTVNSDSVAALPPPSPPPADWERRNAAQLIERAHAVNAGLLESIDKKLSKIIATCDQLEQTVHTDYLLKADAGAAGNIRPAKENSHRAAPLRAPPMPPPSSPATAQSGTARGRAGAASDSTSLRGLADSVSRALGAAEAPTPPVQAPTPPSHVQLRTDLLVQQLQRLVRDKVRKKAEIRVLTQRLL